MGRADVDRLVIETLALSESELKDRVRELEIDNQALRDTLHASVALNQQLVEQNTRLRICLRRNLWETYGAVLTRTKAA
jgi:hypothetical protein